MEKTARALAIKKLQAELKEEKQAEIQRCVRASRLPFCIPLSPRLFSLAGDAKLRRSEDMPQKNGNGQRSSNLRNSDLVFLSPNPIHICAARVEEGSAITTASRSHEEGGALMFGSGSYGPQNGSDPRHMDTALSFVVRLPHHRITIRAWETRTQITHSQRGVIAHAALPKPVDPSFIEESRVATKPKSPQSMVRQTNAPKQNIGLSASLILILQTPWGCLRCRGV
jgi:hypothetical protein